MTKNRRKRDYVNHFHKLENYVASIEYYDYVKVHFFCLKWKSCRFRIQFINKFIPIPNILVKNYIL